MREWWKCQRVSSTVFWFDKLSISWSLLLSKAQAEPFIFHLLKNGQKTPKQNQTISTSFQWTALFCTFGFFFLDGDIFAQLLKITILLVLHTPDYSTLHSEHTPENAPAPAERQQEQNQAQWISLRCTESSLDFLPQVWEERLIKKKTKKKRVALRVSIFWGNFIRID